MEIDLVKDVAYAPESLLGRMAHDTFETMPEGDVVEETHNQQPVWAPSAQMRHRIYMAVAVVFFLLAVLMAFGKAILRDQRFDLPMSLTALGIHGGSETRSGPGPFLNAWVVPGSGLA